ncbi:MAG: hypothetical protein G01um10145_748 [Microgenomates group bacterium Gr01-1014_5]|nr:MAG: hypothetical protein G01um10145_748 [Microgenomates group bacterium Gr01-1014_5]
MLYYRQWEILTGVVETAAGVGVLSVGGILGVKTDLCLEPLAVIVEMNVKYPLGQQAVNRFIAVTVSKEWAMQGRILQGRKGLVSEPQVSPRIMISLEH